MLSMQSDGGLDKVHEVTTRDLEQDGSSWAHAFRLAVEYDAFGF